MTNGLSWSCQTANDIAEYDQAIEAGWFATIELATAAAGESAYSHKKIAEWRKKKLSKKKIKKQAAKIEVPIDSPPTRAELEQKANELNIKFDGRTTDKKLAEKIEGLL